MPYLPQGHKNIREIKTYFALESNEIPFNVEDGFDDIPEEELLNVYSKA